MGVTERRALEKEKRREQILAAAKKILFTTGIADVSVKKIAGAAELGVGTIYFYYKSKEEIFFDLQEEGLKLLYRDIRTICGEKIPADEKIRKTGGAYLDFSIEQKDYFDVLNYFLSSPTEMLTPDMKAHIDFSGRNILSLLRGTVEEGVESGIFREVDGYRTALIFWGTLQGLIQFKKFRNTILKNENHEALYFYAVEQFIEGLYVHRS